MDYPKVIARAVAALKNQQEEIAKASCMFPKADPHAYGIQAGRYQGLQMALDTIDSILRSDDDEE
jgi:hypothetical protein